MLMTKSSKNIIKMEMDCFQNITAKITHVINPNRFYIFDMERSAEILVLRDLELKLQRYCSSYDFPKQIRKLQENDFVGYYSPLSKKWIRCQIDKIEEDVATLWAIDYGVPLTTMNQEKMILLPKEYRQCRSPIIHAGLPILPVQLGKNPATKQVEQVVQERWSEDAVKYFKKILNDCTTVYFHPDNSINHDDIIFGDLTVQMQSGESKTLIRLFLEEQMAITLSNEEFLKSFDRSFSSVLERWDDNCRSSGSLLYPSAHDCVVLGTIASKQIVEIPRQSIANLKEEQMKRLSEREVLISIQKVTEWKKKNEGIEPDPIEESGCETNDEFHSCESLKLKKSSDSSSAQPEKPQNDQKHTLKVSKLEKDPKVLLLSSTISSDQENDCTPNDVVSQMSVVVDHKKDSEYLIERRLKANAESFRTPVNIIPNPPPSDESCGENWMSLKIGREYDIAIPAFNSCSSFYIQVIDEQDGWEDLMEFLNNMAVLEPLKDLSVGKMCLVESLDKELNRAKIIRSSGSSVLCFCVDSAELIYFHKEIEKIYEIPDGILNFMPFQAINCQLSGVKALADYAWSGLIFNKVVKLICTQYLRVIRKLEWNEDLIPKGLEQINSYEVEIIAKGLNDGDFSLADKLVELQFADYDHS